MDRHLEGVLLKEQYRIERSLGRGGFAEVYMATDTKFGARKVAVKVLRPEFSGSEEDVRRFFDEARICGNIHDPNGHIVHVYEFGTWEELHFIVMEFLEGRTLRAEMDGRSRPFAHAEALDIAEQICEGLAVAHRNGVAHRDLKPDNIFLCPTPYVNNVKLLDLGIAKVVDSRIVGQPQHRSRVGAILGTPAYLAPEMFFGKSIDYYLADIYALGVMLYEMLAGETPFHGEGFAYYAYAHANVEPMRPSEVNLGIKLPEAVELLVLRCLAKEPKGRYRSVEDLAIHIRSILAGESRTSRRPLFLGHAVTAPKAVPPAPPHRFPSTPVEAAAVASDVADGRVPSESMRPPPPVAAERPVPALLPVAREAPVAASLPIAAGAAAPASGPGGTFLGLGLAPAASPQRSPAPPATPAKPPPEPERPVQTSDIEGVPKLQSPADPAPVPVLQPAQLSDGSRALFVGLMFIAALILMFTTGTLLIKIVDTRWMPRTTSSARAPVQE